MEKFDPNISQIVNFIFKKPEVVVRILQNSGYSIDMETATLQQIDKLTFEALQKKDEKFAYNLADAIINGDAYSNLAVAIGAVASLAGAVIGSNTAQREGQKQRALMWNMKMAELAQNEKLTLLQIQTTAETERIKILSNSIEKYREALQKEGTIRLRDTWIYLAGLGCAVGIIYALSLMLSKPNTNA